MQRKITVLAPAKINLFLDVLSKRADGYHDISSVMQTIGIFDMVKLTALDPEVGERRIDVTCDGGAPEGEENTVYRAAEQFFNAAEIGEFSVSFGIEKRIPQQAGLGGGSSDAAAAIIALNEVYRTDLSLEQMCKIGAAVGSDVPYCIKKGTCVVGGVGDVLQSTTPMPECVIVVAKPEGESVSTAEAYAKIDAIDAHGDIEKMTSALAECSLEKIGESMFNKFEYVIDERSDIFKLKQTLVLAGSPAVMMTGSGSAVYALYDDVSAAKSAAEALSDIAEVFVCRPVRRAYRFIEQG